MSSTETRIDGTEDDDENKNRFVFKATMRIEEYVETDTSASDARADAHHHPDQETKRLHVTKRTDADDDRRLTTEELREEVARMRTLREALRRAPPKEGSEDMKLLERLDADDAEPRYHAERTLEYTNGDTYVGETVDEIRHGKGRHECSTGDVYDGGWRDDKRHGYGTMRFKSGLTYVGEWADDKTSGRGKCRYVNGDSYDGEWKNDHRWGWGKMVFANTGDTYEGEWVDDVIEGVGLYAYADGSTFQGTTLSGARSRGKFVSGDKSLEYDGEWKDDQRHGRGKFYAKGAFRYVGEWFQDCRQGQGTCEYADGERYRGQWMEDARHGDGEYTCGEYRYVGRFARDLKHGYGVCTFSDAVGGGEYRGEYVDGREHGRGKRLYADGSTYVGEWMCGSRSGKGSCEYANGDRYQGEWSDDVRHGYGVCVFADGTKYRGEWERDCWCQSTADPVFTRVFGPGIVRAVAGRVTAFGIEARDELKNKRLSGGDVFNVKLTLQQSESDGESDAAAPIEERAMVTDNGDGTYVARFSCEVAGTYACQVLIGADEHCGDSPYDVVVLPGPVCAKTSVVSGCGLRRARVGRRAEIVVECLDRFYNRVQRPSADDDDGDESVSISSVLGLRISATDVSGREMETLDDQGVRIEVDENTGNVIASYAPKRAGMYRLVVWSKDETMMGESPYALHVKNENENDDVGNDDGVGFATSEEKPNDLAREWEMIAKADYARDGDDFGWDSGASDDEEETEDARAARKSPHVPVVTNYEDLYKVGRLQRRMKEKHAEEQAAKLADMRAKLEALEMAKKMSKSKKSGDADASASRTIKPPSLAALD